LPSYPDAVSQTETGRPIRVVAIDDHPAILDAIDRAVSERETMTLVGVVRDRDSAERVIVELDPDVVVCDVQLGGNVDGLRLLERFTGRSRPIFLVKTVAPVATSWQLDYATPIGVLST